MSDHTKVEKKRGTIVQFEKREMSRTRDSQFGDLGFLVYVIEMEKCVITSQKNYIYVSLMSLE